VKLPASWNGENNLKLIDALFTSASAVCGTGLITVDTAQYGRFGQIVIAALIQLGGLGLISFSYFYLVLQSKGPSIKGGRVKNPLFVSVFHSISAFCNAGFSTFSNSLESYRGSYTINITIMLLIISGGTGFVVFRDVLKTLLRINHKRHLTAHSKILLQTSTFLVTGGAIIIFLIENSHYLVDAGIWIRTKT